MQTIVCILAWTNGELLLLDHRQGNPFDSSWGLSTHHGMDSGLTLGWGPDEAESFSQIALRR